jgi:hypothetical protein
MQKQEKPLTREVAEARIRLLSDRLAVSLVLLKKRHGDDWNPWAGEAMWEQVDGLAEEIRDWPDFKVALGVVELFIRRNERELGKD